MRTWNHVDPLLARATMDIANSLNPQGWREVAAADEPGTYDAVREHFNRTGKIAVARQSDFINGSKRLWGSADVWQAFFVWHDWSHIHACDGSFDPAGEARTHALQVKHLHSWANTLMVRPTFEALQRSEMVLAAHNLGRLEHWRATGGPPDNLREFTGGYLAARDLAVQPAIFAFPDQFPQETREWIAAFMASLGIAS